MTNEQFETIANKLLDHAATVRTNKAAEYASDTDRLRNFRKAAALASVEVPAAITGMMLKHTVSIYDMVDNVYTQHMGAYTDDIWLEKLGDQINYLLLLYAAIVEDREPNDDTIPN